MAASNAQPRGPLLSPGQTMMFLGDHTSPDHPGYVALLDEVLSRFHPEMRLRLITAGAPGQTASGLRLPELMQLLSSARPDWLVIGIGLADAMREPDARRLLDEYNRAQRDEPQSPLDATFGPELKSETPTSPSSLHLEKTEAFAENLRQAVDELQRADVRVCLLTTILVGNSAEHPLNRVLQEYNRVIRELAQESRALVVDVEAAFRDVLDRAANYKQKVALIEPGGELNGQGQALVARTVLSCFGVLPGGRSR